ncbi:MAG: hypothetical protein ABL879_12815 [Devosia sp.]
MRDPLLPLTRLLESGDLRLVYVLGVARSNTTLVVRLLGEQLDGAVYEPTVPATLDPVGHFAHTVLRAYRKARATRSGTVTLAVKDISLFIEPSVEAFIAERASHVVITVRDPAEAHASLVKQFRHEFGFWQRFDAVVRQPFEALFMFIAFLFLVPRYGNLARSALPDTSAGRYRMAMAGWSLESWNKLTRQVAAIPPGRLTVLDARQMRNEPALAAAALTAIARSLMPAGRKPMIEVAAHSRMSSRSKWAAEARASAGIKPTNASAPVEAPDDVAAAVAAKSMPQYRALIDSAANPLRVGNTAEVRLGAA